MRTALIFGAGGQDGSYMAEILLAKGYEVWGTHRRSSVDNLIRVRHLIGRPGFELLRCDVTDAGSVRAAFNVDPDEVYHLADQDNVGWSEDTPGYTAAVTYGGAANVLQAAASYNAGHAGRDCKVFVPSSVTIYGPDQHGEFDPRSPYAVAKLGVLYLCRHYRYMGLNVTCGVMGNHDSPRRPGTDYVLQKIARGVPLAGTPSRTLVDVGYAREFMEAAHELTSAGTNLDAVIKSGRRCSLADLVAYRAGSADVWVTRDDARTYRSVAAVRSGGQMNAFLVLDMIMGRKPEPEVES